MKYSIKGNLSMSDGSVIVSKLNEYTLWRLVTGQTKYMNGDDLFTFEAWLNTEVDKSRLFNELKPLVDQYGELISWHICTHDELTPSSCVIEEEYRGE